MENSPWAELSGEIAALLPEVERHGLSDGRGAQIGAALENWQNRAQSASRPDVSDPAELRRALQSAQAALTKGDTTRVQAELRRVAEEARKPADDWVGPLVERFDAERESRL